MKMNHYLFIKEDNDSFYEVEAPNIKEAMIDLLTDNEEDDDLQLVSTCFRSFDDNDTDVVTLYNKFVVSSDRISRVMIVDTIYDDRF